MVGSLHHVAIVVRSIAEALPFYTDVLGLEAGAPAELPEQRVRAAFVGSRGALLELIEPTDDASGVARFLAERGRSTLHHVCYEVADVGAALRDLAARGIELVDARPRRGVHGDIAFLHPRAAGGVLVELIEKGSLDGSHTGRG